MHRRTQTGTEREYVAGLGWARLRGACFVSREGAPSILLEGGWLWSGEQLWKDRAQRGLGAPVGTGLGLRRLGLGVCESPTCYASQWTGPSLERRLQMRGLWARLGLMGRLPWFKQYFLI